MTYLFIITYLNKTKTFYLINSKNLPGELYATTVPGFSTLTLLMTLKMRFLISLKNVSTDNVPYFLNKSILYAGNYCL